MGAGTGHEGSRPIDDCSGRQHWLEAVPRAAPENPADTAFMCSSKARPCSRRSVNGHWAGGCVFRRSGRAKVVVRGAPSSLPTRWASGTLGKRFLGFGIESSSANWASNSRSILTDPRGHPKMQPPRTTLRRRRRRLDQGTHDGLAQPIENGFVRLVCAHHH